MPYQGGFFLDFTKIIDQLKKKFVDFEKGLSEKEMEVVENRYGILFPPDLKLFLMTEMPVSSGFIDWRDDSSENISEVKSRLGIPLEGLIFDIKYNHYWFDAWGQRPDDLRDAIDVCKREYAKIPKLIPVYSHRYIPMCPYEVGNPIFSIHQTDVINYGEDLISYLKVEFSLKKYRDIKFDMIKEINFWSAFT